MTDLPRTPPEGPPRRKPGPPKGFRKGVKTGGRKKGVPNRATQERELQLRLEAERVKLLEAIATGAPGEVEAVKAQAAGKKLMKDQAFDFAALFASMAAYYQPQPTIVAGKVVNLDANPNANEEKFKEYALMASQLAVASAKYQSPSFSAMVIGASVVTKVEIVGGMTDDFRGPVAPDQTLDLKPLTIITADDDVIEVPVPKAVGQ